MAGDVPVQHDPGGSAQVEQNMDIDAVSLVCRGTVESTSVALLASMSLSEVLLQVPDGLNLHVFRLFGGPLDADAYASLH